MSAGTLAIGASGSINGSSDLFIGQGSLLQVTAGTTGGSQLPNAGNLTFSGGVLGYAANGSFCPGESVGALVLNPGQSQIVLSNAGKRNALPVLRQRHAAHDRRDRGLFDQRCAGPVPCQSARRDQRHSSLCLCGPVNSTTVDFATRSTSARRDARLGP